MRLPPPNNKGEGPWNDYRIDTPTFQLTPVEKPDMSPYLVHMTGKNSIYSILTGGSENKGLIKASIPQQSKSEWYKEKIVCFTESPIFALDAFRYISFPRWQRDMRYGIGFSKLKLAKKGVRPAIYLDANLLTLLAKLNSLVKPNPEHGLKKISKELRDALTPLMTPLMESAPKQGFLWEREWRYPNAEGFEFEYSDIKIICCPEDEQNKIAEILGVAANSINFVRQWSQYDEVTDFINARGFSWKSKLVVKDFAVQELATMKLQYTQELHKADAYRIHLEKTKTEIEHIEKYIKEMELRIEEISNELNCDYCCCCSSILNEETGMIPWNDDDGQTDYLCANCHYMITVELPSKED